MYLYLENICIQVSVSVSKLRSVSDLYQLRLCIVFWDAATSSAAVAAPSLPPATVSCLCVLSACQGSAVSASAAAAAAATCL